MLKSLSFKKELPKEEALKARIDKDLYEKYKSETAEIAERFNKSVENVDWSKISIHDCFSHLPFIINQQECDDIVFDPKGCWITSGIKSKPDGYLTMADGGTIPCAMFSVVDFFTQKADLEELGKVLVENGYRTDGNGVLWSALDIVPEIQYGIPTKIAESVEEMLEAIGKGKPVFILAPAKWFQDKPIATNQAAVIWGIRGSNFIMTTTTEEFIIPEIKETISQIKRAWIFG